MQTAPIGFAAVGWKYFLVVICWSVFFLPVIYFFWPETARLTLEEIGKQFGDDVAVHLTDATDEEKAALDRRLTQGDATNNVDVATIAGGSPSEINASGSSKDGDTKE